MQSNNSKPKVLFLPSRRCFAFFALPFALISLFVPTYAAESVAPHIQYFYARSQSPYYLGNAADGTPQFAAGKALEFEFLACPTDAAQALQATVFFGNGDKRVFNEVSCSPTIFPYTYSKPQNEAIVALEVKTAAGKTDLQAVKISVAPLPKDTKTAAAAFGPPVITESTTPAVAARPTPEVAVGQDLSKQLAESESPDTNSAAKVAAPGVQVSAGQAALTQQAAASATTTAGSPILGAFVTGVLILVFFVAAFSGIRWLLTR